MKRNIASYGPLLLIFALSITITGQTPEKHEVSNAFAVLTKSVDSKTAAVGQEVTLRAIGDLMVDNLVVIPKDSRLVGRVAGASTKGKDQSQSRIAIAIDRAIKPDGVEIPLQAIIAAIAAPRDTSLTSDPAYGMLHSNEPKMVGSTLPAASKADSTAAVATANLKGAILDSLLLNENSQGAIGYEGLTITWQFTLLPPLTVFSTRSNNLKLMAGTQMLLRMVPPRLPH